MKRDKYKIFCNGQLVAVRFAWNSARDEVRNQIRGKLTLRQTAEIVSEQYGKCEQGVEHIRGVQLWRTSAGKHYIYKIVKVTE